MKMGSFLQQYLLTWTSVTWHEMLPTGRHCCESLSVDSRLFGADTSAKLISEKGENGGDPISGEESEEFCLQK